MPIDGYTGKSLQDAPRRRHAVLFHAAAVKLANQSLALHQVEAKLRNSELTEESGVVHQPVNVRRSDHYRGNHTNTIAHELPDSTFDFNESRTAGDC